MVKCSLKKGDEVVIITGDHKGKKGTILRIIPKDHKAIVGGCNIVKKTVKPSENNPKGGFIFKEYPIHISNMKKLV